MCEERRIFNVRTKCCINTGLIIAEARYICTRHSVIFKSCIFPHGLRIFCFIPFSHTTPIFPKHPKMPSVLLKTDLVLYGLRNNFIQSLELLEIQICLLSAVINVASLTLFPIYFFFVYSLVFNCRLQMISF